MREGWQAVTPAATVDEKPQSQVAGCEACAQAQSAKPAYHALQNSTPATAAELPRVTVPTYCHTAEQQLQ